MEFDADTLKRGNLLAEKCRTLNQKFVTVIPRLTNEEVLADLLAVNDLLHKSLDRFTAWSKQSKSKGKEVSANGSFGTSPPTAITSAPPTQPPPSTAPAVKSPPPQAAPAPTSGSGKDLISLDSTDALLTVPSKSSVITDEFGEFILADLNEALSASEKSDLERTVFEALRKEEEFTEYQTSGPTEEEEDDDDFPDFKLVSTSTDSGNLFLLSFFLATFERIPFWFSSVIEWHDWSSPEKHV